MAIKQIHITSDILPAYGADDNHSCVSIFDIKEYEKDPPEYDASEGNLQDMGAIHLVDHQPLVISLPDPENIQCRCGRYHDTTTGFNDLPDGIVRCECGYIVSSAGWSRWEPRTIACPTPECFTFVSWPRKQKYVCTCGIGLNTDGNVCIPHLGWKRDLTKVRCRCGKYVDTTKHCIVVHEDQKYYEHALPQGSGCCDCGRTVWSDGTSTYDHFSDCSSIISGAGDE